MYNEKLSPFALAVAKISMYQKKHGGKSPAKIFVSNGMLLDITKDIRCNHTVSISGEHTLLGIPVSVFIGDECPGFYLSDEEE